MSNKWAKQYKRDMKAREKIRRHRSKGHEDAAKIHARVKARLRCNLALTKTMESRIITKIETGQVFMTRRNSWKRAVYRIPWEDGRVFEVVYDKAWNCLVTMWEVASDDSTR